MNEPKPSRLTRIGFGADLRVWRESATVVGVVAVMLTWVYRLWDVHWKVPFNYSGDGLSTAAYTKSIMENGWYFNTPRLAAPYAADWRDFPVGGENIHWFSLKILGYLTGNYATAINVYFFGSFFAIALTAYFVARYLRFGRAASLVVGVLYAFLPYHAYRNTAHLARGVYYLLPLLVLVVLWVADYRNQFLRLDGEKLRWRRGRVGFALAVALVLGASDTQNSVFLLSILALFVLVEIVRDRDWRPVALLAVIGAATFGSLVLNNSPYIVSRLENGANNEALARSTTDTDYYGLRPVNLLLPAPGHRIGVFDTYAKKSARAQVTNSESPGTSLGLVGAFGLIVSVGALIAAGLGGRRRGARSEFLARLGLMNVLAILIGAIGGLSFLVALAGLTQYRTWNRISLFIGFGALLATGVVLDVGFRRLRSKLSRGVATGLIVAIAGVLVVGGVFDQITPTYVPDYKTVATRFDIDATFYHDLEKALPRGAMVFQLPVVPFPEAGKTVEQGDYQEFTGYLHTKDLRFSYGGIRGRREGDWQKNLSIYDPVAMLSQVAAIGFDAVVLDRTGFDDGGARVLAAAKPLVGDPKLRSTDDRLLFLDLRPLRATLDAELGADAVKHSADLALNGPVAWKNFSFPEPTCDGIRRWATSRTGFIDLTNDTKAPVTLDFSTQFEANPASSSIDVRAPGFSGQVPLRNGRGAFAQRIELPPGVSTLRFSVNGPKVVNPQDARTLWFSLLGARFGGQFESPVAAWAHAKEPPCKSG